MIMTNAEEIEALHKMRTSLASKVNSLRKEYNKKSGQLKMLGDEKQAVEVYYKYVLERIRALLGEGT